RALDDRPHDRLGATVKGAVHRELHELARDLGLRVVAHRRVRIVPVAYDAEALELLALDTDPLLGEGAAVLPQLRNGHRVLRLALGPVLLLDLPFDRQAVAIPAWYVVGVAAHHLL